MSCRIPLVVPFLSQILVRKELSKVCKLSGHFWPLDDQVKLNLGRKRPKGNIDRDVLGFSMDIDQSVVLLERLFADTWISVTLLMPKTGTSRRTTENQIFPFGSPTLFLS